ncbi:hypothetical protein LEMA_P102730.1 [Plenodomus lingam JN3]|uniref:Dienelactone hydrolase domain-containing protein n=1 Tax=Leptosphaeria maculans (strain JN3 / isolate v23.1.3 / race Av1-4-5-6-7-8) TaxID=985895 RepID=E4ZZM6_LEPMJ|nr:hypothetical protein LEMA_P102730.1 [Plenodomus lingam JN3]CBX97142.1 hypothetical protein LEMA_P102730.1 [Plenodomus lingam JN3]
MVSIKNLVFGLSTAGLALAQSTCSNLQVRSEGEPAGEIRNIGGFPTYLSYPSNTTKATKAILYISDIFGIPRPENRLLADSLAANGYLVVMPDIYYNDSIPVDTDESTLDLSSWLPNHPPEGVDAVINSTLSYMRGELGMQRIGAVGYCFGGKFVPRWLREDEGLVDAGFIAHPSFMLDEDLMGVVGGLSIAAGSYVARGGDGDYDEHHDGDDKANMYTQTADDPLFNTTQVARAEEILAERNSTFQVNLYALAQHGFAVKVNASMPAHVFAKQASFVQAVTYFDMWL